MKNHDQIDAAAPEKMINWMQWRQKLLINWLQWRQKIMIIGIQATENDNQWRQNMHMLTLEVILLQVPSSMTGSV